MSESSIIITRDGSAISVFFPIGSARNISTTVDQVFSGDMRRTVNGRLIDLTRPELRKFNVSLSAIGMAFPDFRGMWRGQLVTVSPPIFWTAYAPELTEAIILDRPAQPGTWSLRDAETGAIVDGATLSADGMTLTLPELSDAVSLEYQPVFECRVASVSVSGDEWEASASWSLNLEEV